MTGRFERKLRAAIAIYTKCAGKNKSGTKMAGRRGQERLYRGGLALDDEQKLTKRLRPTRAFQIGRTVLPKEVCLLRGFPLEVVRYDHRHRSQKGARLSIPYLRQIKWGHRGPDR